MFSVFDGRTADEVWQKLVESFRKGQCSPGQKSRAGGTSEILHAAITVSDPRQRWIVSRRPALNVAFAIAEVIWILRGRNDSRFLNYFNSKLPKFAGTGAFYHGAYGHRLRRSFGIDQLERTYSTLRHAPESRQVVLQIWDAVQDLPDSRGQAVSPDIPCNVTSLLKVRNGKLEWLQIMRSNDVFRGFPYNVVQFTVLQEVLAGWLGIGLGEYHHISDSLHLYDETADEACTSVPLLSPENMDNLALSKPVSDAAFASLENLILRIIDPAHEAKHILDFFIAQNLPTSFQNLGLILCAEAARRRSENLVDRCLAECDNPLLISLYDAWLCRTRNSAKALK